MIKIVISLSLGILSFLLYIVPIGDFYIGVFLPIPGLIVGLLSIKDANTGTKKALLYLALALNSLNLLMSISGIIIKSSYQRIR